MKLVNKTGYLKGAKTAKNPVNIIPSNLITTQGMAFPIKANGKTLYPNTGQYKFPTSPVIETPLKKKFQEGTNELVPDKRSKMNEKSLSKAQEIAYQRWRKSKNLNESDDYDLREYWKNVGYKNIGATDNSAHLTDPYKRLAPFSEGDNYPTLSDESNRASKFDKRGQGTWVGEGDSAKYVNYQKGTKKTKTFKFNPNTSLAGDNTVNTQGREDFKTDKLSLQKTKDFNTAVASGGVTGDKGAEDKFYARYGEGSGKFKYDTDSKYREGANKKLKAAEKAKQPILREDVKLDPNAMFMLPIGLKGQAAKDYQNFHKEIIASALPIPGIPKGLRQGKNIPKQMPAQVPTLSNDLINLERQSSKPKNTIFKFNIDVPHPSFRIRKRFRGDKDMPKELIIEGKSGQWKANRRSEDNSYYFNASMSNPLESGKAMLEMDKLLPVKPSIYETNSLSLDSYKALLNLKNRKNWSGEHIGSIPLNKSAIHNKTLNKLGLESSSEKAYFNSLDEANATINEVNQMLRKHNIEHKANIVKHSDDTYSVDIPNFKLNRDYKKGTKTIKYKEGSKGVSLAFSRGEKDPKGGLTQKGVDKYNRATGGNLKMAVTTPPSKLKAGSKAANRRKSFCARMSGVDGPMEKNGKPTRKALALRKWNC
jgi:hypothetical protein